MSRDCQKATPLCYNCNQHGHISRDCQNPRTEKACYRCNSTGHVVRTTLGFFHPFFFG